MASLGNQEEVDYYRNDSPGVVVSILRRGWKQKQHHNGGRVPVSVDSKVGGGLLK